MAKMSVFRLREALESCSTLFQTGDFSMSEEAVAGVAGLLESMVESRPTVAEDVLDEIHRFLSCPDSNQMAVDALSLELSQVVIRFASLSDNCEVSAGNIIKHLVGICSPRDMLAIFCELVSNLPCNERFVILKALITNSGSPSMMAILIDLVKEEIHMASRQRNLTGADDTSKQDNYKASPFWSADVLDVVEFILKPSKGGLPPPP